MPEDVPDKLEPPCNILFLTQSMGSPIASYRPSRRNINFTQLRVQQLLPTTEVAVRAKKKMSNDCEWQENRKEDNHEMAQVASGIPQSISHDLQQD
eukprot:5925963-Amphidinium_carterae.1